MKKTAKYLVYMLTVVLIASVIGVAFAWYTSNTEVTATTSATAAKAENVNISFMFKEDEGDSKDHKLYLSTMQLITDYYNRKIYSGEEGWSADLKGMVGAATQIKKEDGNDKVYLTDPNVRADQINELAEYLGTRDHVFTLYYYIEIKNDGSAVSFGLNLNTAKIYKNGVTIRDTKGDEVENAYVEYPAIIGEGDDAKPVDGTIAKVTIGSETGNTVCYFDVTDSNVYGEIDENGNLSGEVLTNASYSVADCKLTVGGTDYVLSGHEADKNTSEARYFKRDDEEINLADSTIKNFVFNFYQLGENQEKPDDGLIYNKAHVGDYNLYTDGDVVFAEAGESITLAEGETAKIIIAITHFQEIDETTEVNAIFPYSGKEYMKAHFKFNISAELVK